MKKTIFLSIILFITSCGGRQKNTLEKPELPVSGITEFEVNKEMHNFGELEAGEIVIFNFIFKNTGNNNLIISNIEKDCGCLDIKFNSNPVPPGEKGIIEVFFDTSGLYGNEFKVIKVHSNIKEKTKELAITAEIKNKNLIINKL